MVSDFMRYLTRTKICHSCRIWILSQVYPKFIPSLTAFFPHFLGGPINYWIDEILPPHLCTMCFITFIYLQSPSPSSATKGRLLCCITALLCWILRCTAKHKTFATNLSWGPNICHQPSHCISQCPKCNPLLLNICLCFNLFHPNSMTQNTVEYKILCKV